MSLAFNAIVITSLDDVAFSNNQCECNLLDDFVIMQVLLFGFSVRMNDNRMKEGLMNAMLSAISIGWMNSTTANQGTHCMLVGALIPALRVDAANKSIIDAMASGYCKKIGDAFAKSMGVFK
jgi:hypothetical protein